MSLVSGRFDASGELYATLTADSRLKIWEVATGNVRVEFTPTTHLADAFTCLAWGHATVCGVWFCLRWRVVWVVYCSGSCGFLQWRI